jgi:drug/metabolite transporter (DMT)-like permease
MPWFVLALLAPLCWSAANYLDKYVMARSRPDGAGGAYGLLILSAAISAVFAIVLGLWTGVGSMLDVPSGMRLLLALSGAFEAAYLLSYFIALGKESATTVNVLFQFAPIFGLAFGFVFLRELPTLLQLLAIALILGGSLAVVWKPGEKFEMRKDVIGYMLLSTASLAAFNLLFKAGSEGIGFWQSVFWQYLGIGGIGALLALVPAARHDLVTLVKGRGARMLSVTGGAEGMNILAILATNAAVLAAPIAIVISIASVQPVLVFAEGMLLGPLFPKLKDVFAAPPLTARVVAGILLACLGGFLIVR